MVPISMLVLIVGSHLGVIETTYQPMKIAAMPRRSGRRASPCSFSAAQIGGWTTSDETATKIIAVPHLLSLLATGSWNGQVVGINELQAQYQQEYGPGNYIPNLFIQYWSMRVMAYIGSVLPLLALWGAWLWWRKKLATARGFLWVGTWAAVAPFIMNTAGWLLTENGRQPWAVQGLLLTQNGNSPSVSLTEVAISLGSFWVVYLILGVVWGFLMTRFGRRPLEVDEDLDEDLGPDRSPRTPALTY